MAFKASLVDPTRNLISWCWFRITECSD